MKTQTEQAEQPLVPFETAAALIRAGEWRDGLAAYEKGLKQTAEPDGELLLLAAIARVRANLASLTTLTPALVREGEPQDVRRLLANPLAQEGKLADAAQAFGAIIDALPSAVDERMQRSSLYARLGLWDEAIADLDAVAGDPGAAEGLGVDLKRLQYFIRAGRAPEGAVLAREMDPAGADDRTLNLMLLALIHAKEYTPAADLTMRINTNDVGNAQLAGSIVQSLFWAERYTVAIEIGEKFVRRGLDGAMLRSFLGRAWYAGGAASQRFAKAIGHFEVGITHSPDDLRMVSLLGELLLHSGKAERALPHLRKAVEMQPNMAQVRARYARALKQSGKFADAAEHFVAAAKTPKGAGLSHRHVAGALSLAGRREEAADMYDAWVSSRAQDLPESFAEGLHALWGRVEDVNIPLPRLDWAWSLRSPDCPFDRAEWERRAKWGHLADHYLLDWIECRGEQAEEAMRYFSDELDAVEAFIAEARARAPGKGLIFASAHVGAMYFGPLALELVGERSRWLASTPSVARTSYAETLISTNDQTDAQVAMAFMRALKQNYAVIVVVDGAINVAAPRVEFEGQEITFSQFTARTAHRLGAPSAFVSPVWREGDKIGFVLEHLPMPEQGEIADDYAARWQQTYFDYLRRCLSGRPENLRLSGGIWRHIR
jgi:tetratricopeptide (TPR) repeat protein